MDAYAHEHSDPAAAAWWTVIQEDATRDVAVRTCAAVANARLGFPHGEDYCIAVLRAGLLSSQESDRKHAIPETDRLAFAREIALDWLHGRLADAAIVPPPFDVNYGAPQLEAATKALETACKALGALRPDADAASLSSRIPESAPPGLDPRHWLAARERCLQECRR
ncbi:MAG: hypothetical protein H6832_10130 [Planctomycetes bacterium]|nr:hypothetical protein [Planctomycetota bacterium]MCB9918746.1 hypothetical protein [Planctomycetota bacterium]